MTYDDNADDRQEATRIPVVSCCIAGILGTIAIGWCLLYGIGAWAVSVAIALVAFLYVRVAPAARRKAGELADSLAAGEEDEDLLRYGDEVESCECRVTADDGPTEKAHVSIMERGLAIKGTDEHDGRWRLRDVRLEAQGRLSVLVEPHGSDETLRIMFPSARLADELMRRYDDIRVGA